MTLRTYFASLALTLCAASAGAAGVVVIGHPALAKLDAVTVQKIYTGKVIEVGGQAVVPVNSAVGSSLRLRFLQAYLSQDEDKYTAYWTVRRYIGKGAPPKELTSAAELIQFVQGTSGGVAYIDETDLKPNLNVLLRR